MICSKCKNERDESAFSFRNKSLGIRHSVCKFCHKHSARAHYDNNKEKYIERAKEKNKEIDLAIESLLLEAKSVPCADCGQCFHHCVMDFDHVNGDKVGNVADIRRQHSIRKLKAEMAKCEVVCANCHRLRTYMRMQSTAATFS